MSSSCSEIGDVWSIALPVRSLRVQCEDCGNALRLSQAKIKTMRLPSRSSLLELGPRFVCAACRADGRPGRNVRISPVLQVGYPMENA